MSRTNGPVIGAFLVFENFMSGSAAITSYYLGKARKLTAWKGIYLEQIAYPFLTNALLDPHHKFSRGLTFDKNDKSSIFVDRYLGLENDNTIQPCNQNRMFGGETAWFLNPASQKKKHSQATQGGVDSAEESEEYPYSIVGAHAVAIMGWGWDYVAWPTGKVLVKFWYVRNSWQDNWGDKGYFRMAWGITIDDRKKERWVTYSLNLTILCY